MKRTLLVILLSILGVMLSAGKVPEDFTLGAYTYWQSKDGNRPWSQASDSLLVNLRTAHFNTMMIDYYNGDKELPKLLDKLAKADIDAIITDFQWNNLADENVYSTRNLSLSNYLKIEAEYASAKSVSRGDATSDLFSYQSQNLRSKKDSRRGRSSSQSANYSNSYAWICSPGADKAGYAFEDIHYRWSDKRRGNIGLGNEFQFLKYPWEPKLDETYLSQTFLNFDFALKISNHADLVSAGREGKYLLRFELVGVDKSGKRISLKHKHENAKEASTESFLTAKAYLALSRKDDLGNSRIKLSINLKDLKDSGLLIENEAGRYQMRDVHPRIYWYENSKLEIDYLEVYDDLYQSIKTNPERYALGINSRLENIRNLSSAKIRFMYSFDEPNQAQFAAFKQIQELIEAPNPTIITAIYDWKHYLKKPDKEDYNHQVNFIKQAEPMVLCPDIYPLDRWQSWKPKAFQRIIDSRVTDKYMQWRTLIEEGKKAGKEMHFMPIVQSFGDWFSKDEAWGWMLPPYETQKMLQYLPLCYGPIGILNYVFPWWIGDKLAEPQTYGPLMIHTSQTPFSYERTESFRALQEANGKIQIYGNIVKDLDWETAATLRLFRNPRGELAQFGIEKIRVAWNWKEFKRQGYVQMGVYTDEQGLPSLVLVNRRSNESSRELPGRIKLDEYKANFKAASSQQVILSLNGKVLSGRAKDITIYDPFLLEGQEIIHSGLKAKNIKLKYSIDAGEAMMLRVVNTLPLNLVKDVELEASYALTARGVVSSNSTLKLGKNAELALLKGSSLVIDSGSTAILKGEISAHPDAKIEVYGQLVISGKNKSRLKDNIIIQPGGVVSLGD